MKTFRIFALLTLFFLTLIIAVWSFSGKDLFYDTFESSNFEADKQNILFFLNEEMKYTENADEQKELKNTIDTLSKQNDETEFFDMLNTFFDEDTFVEYEWSQEERSQILKSLQEEIGNIENKDVQITTQTLFTSLKNTTDEDTFFEILENIYSTLDNYYESENIFPFGGEDIEFEEENITKNNS